MRRVEHDDDEPASLVSLDRKIESARFSEIDTRRRRNPRRQLLVLVCILDRTSQRQQLNVLELNVARGFAVTLARIELGNYAVDDVSIIIDHQNVFDANV